MHNGKEKHITRRNGRAGEEEDLDWFKIEGGRVN